MESKQYYLRDIRDAINGKEPSMAGVNGNSDVKYLKDIADAIRNGGGVSDDNDKVKQIDASDNKEYRVLLSNSNTDETETNFAHKDGDFTYNPSSRKLTLNGQSNDVTKIGPHSIETEAGVHSSYVGPELIRTTQDYSNEQRTVSLNQMGTYPSVEVLTVEKDPETGATIPSTLNGIIVEDNDIITYGENHTWDGVHASLKEALAGGGFEKMNYYEYISDPSHFIDGKIYMLDPTFTSADDVMTENEPRVSSGYDANDLVSLPEWFNFDLQSLSDRSLCIDNSPYQTDKCFVTFQGPRYDWTEIYNTYQNENVVGTHMNIGADDALQIPKQWTYNGKTYYLKDYSYFYYFVGYYNFDFEGIIYITNNTMVYADPQTAHYHIPAIPDGFVFRYENGASVVPVAEIYRPQYSNNNWNINVCSGYGVGIAATNGQYISYAVELITGSESPQIVTDHKVCLNYMLFDYMNKYFTVAMNIAQLNVTNKDRYSPTFWKNGFVMKDDTDTSLMGLGVKKYIYHQPGKIDNVIYYSEAGESLTSQVPFLIEKDIIHNCRFVVAHIGVISDGNETEYDVTMDGYEGSVNGDYGSVAYSRHAGTNNDEFSMTFTFSDVDIVLYSVAVKKDVKTEGWLEEIMLINGVRTKVFGLHPVEIDSGSYAMLSNDDKQSPSQLYFIPDES